MTRITTRGHQHSRARRRNIDPLRARRLAAAAALTIPVTLGGCSAPQTGTVTVQAEPSLDTTLKVTLTPHLGKKRSFTLSPGNSYPFAGLPLGDTTVTAHRVCTFRFTLDPNNRIATVKIGHRNCTLA